MAFTGTKVVKASNVADLNTLVAAEITAGNSPVGAPQLSKYQEYPEIWTIYQSISVGISTVTSYKLLQADSDAALTALVNTEVTGGALLLGGCVVAPSSQNTSRAKFFQATYKGTAAPAGMGAAGPQGAQGPQGADGPQGPQGAQGPQA